MLPPPVAAQPVPARPARGRASEGTFDVETLLREVVTKLQNQGSAEAERLRDGIRRAITILQGLVG